jgi:hypothetical protein
LRKGLPEGHPQLPARQGRNLGESTAQAILLEANLSGFPVVGLAVDAPVQPVVIQDIQAALESTKFSLFAAQSCSRTARSLWSVVTNSSCN